MTDALVALNRFGLGARPDDRAPAEPRRWLLDQLERFVPALPDAPSTAAAASAVAAYQEQRRRARLGEASAADAMALRREGRVLYAEAAGARMNAALATPAPFAERLVHFWANHFAVSADKLAVIGLAGPFEFEAIRPNLLGRFRDLLRAAVRHPAMLLYLDQAQSVGPASPLGSRVAERQALMGTGRKVGLNENLAREIMELHTLGVRTGYTQSDVTELARALTGWTVTGIGRGPAARAAGVESGAPGAFLFADRLHEPGARTLIGRRYDAAGVRQAEAMLDDLAAHPATARHIATKLVRHFVADVPPQAAVARVEAAFLRSGGDLPTVYRALVDAPEAWAPVSTKFKTPWDWSVSVLRAVGTREVTGAQTLGLLDQLGQPLWRPGSPAGWDDVAASWAGPDAILRRVEVAERLAGRVGPIDARARAAVLFPDALSLTTAQAIARAESPPQALALLLVAPEMMRR